MKHGPGSQRKSEGHQTSQKGIRRHRTCGVETVRIDKEVDALLEDDVEACSDKYSGENLNGPWGNY
jgi:hypothetical protein